MLGILHNPRYAGAFVYGRTRQRKVIIAGQARFRRIPRADWKVFLPNTHPGYIGWEEFETNQATLLANANAYGPDRRRSPAREGVALLQGLVICGRCGTRMAVRYNLRRGHPSPDYLCQRRGIQLAQPLCQTIPGTGLDAAVAQVVLEAVTPAALEVALEVFDELRARKAEVDRLRRAQVERAREEAEIAQRQFMLVRPEHRLVADSLEQQWNAKLARLVEVEEEYRRTTTAHGREVPAAQAEVRRAARGLDAARARWVEAKSGARPQEIEQARAELDQSRQRWENLELERKRFKKLVDDGLIAKSQYDAAETDAGIWKAKVRVSEEALNLLLAGPKPETIEAAWARVQEAEAELSRAETELAQALAELAHTRAMLASTVVDATVNGKVTRKLVEPGEAVDISMPLMVLGDVAKVIVKAEVDETDVGKLALGQRAEVTADAYPGRVFPGKIIEIGQAVGKPSVRPEDPAKKRWRAPRPAGPRGSLPGRPAPRSALPCRSSSAGRAR